MWVSSRVHQQDQRGTGSTFFAASNSNIYSNLVSCQVGLAPRRSSCPVMPCSLHIPITNGVIRTRSGMPSASRRLTVPSQAIVHRYMDCSFLLMARQRSSDNLRYVFRPYLPSTTLPTSASLTTGTTTSTWANMDQRKEIFSSQSTCGKPCRLDRTRNSTVRARIQVQAYRSIHFRIRKPGVSSVIVTVPEKERWVPRPTPTLKTDETSRMLVSFGRPQAKRLTPLGARGGAEVKAMLYELGAQ